MNNEYKIKHDPYYDPKYKGVYYGNGLYGPEPEEPNKYFCNGNWPVWGIILILCCVSPE